MQLPQESSNPFIPLPSEVIKLTKPTLQHRLRIQKLLQLRTPAEDFRAFMDQSPIQIAKALFEIKLNLTFNTWFSYLNEEENFRLALTHHHHDWLRKQYIREILLFTTAQDIPWEKYFKLISNLFSRNDLEYPLEFVKYLDKNSRDFIRSWSVEQRFNFLLFMLNKINFSGNNGTFQKFCAFPFVRHLVRDFSSEKLVELLSGISTLKKTHFDHEKTISPEQVNDNNRSSIAALFTSELTINKYAIRLYNSEAAEISLDSFKKARQDSCKQLTPSELTTIIKRHPMVVLSIMQLPEYLPNFTADKLFELAKVNLLFSVEIIAKICNGELAIANDHLLSQIARNGITHFDSFLAKAQKGLKLSDLSNSEVWILARLIYEGLNCDPDLLFNVVSNVSANHYADRNYLNQLLITAYESGNLNAGIRLADHLWNGTAIYPNQQLALEIYHDICEQQPELLTPEALDRLTEEKLIDFMAQYGEFTAKLSRLADLKQKSLSNSKPQLISALKSNMHNSTLTKFHPKINQGKKIAEFEQEINTLAEQLIAIIDPIVSLPIPDSPQFQNHLPWLTTHMLMIRVLIEQKDLIQDTPSWLAAFKRSIKCAWHYDTLENADPELVTILKRIKEMYKHANYETAINSIKLDQHVQTHQERFFKPVNDEAAVLEDINQSRRIISRSPSMPALLNPAKGLSKW